MIRSGSPHDGSFTILSWDSERFGFPVARITDGTTGRELPAVVDALRKRKIGLAYLFSKSEPSPVELSILLSVGARLVDEKRTYISATRRVAADRQGYEIRPYVGTDVDRLISLSRAAGAWSRFRTDPRVPASVFEAIYDAWITRSVHREIADVVIAAYDSRNVPVGLATVGRKEGRANIGLVAVDEIARGKGIGRGLVNAVSSWAWEQQLSEIHVTTQGANQAACSLYEACGFAISRVEYVYHLWQPFDRTALDQAG